MANMFLASGQCDQLKMNKILLLMVMDMRMSDWTKLVWVTQVSFKGVHVLRGYFGPLLSQKLKVAFHQFYLIGL